ncbi:hypothetical protein [Niastella sp. OAS944]|uniref:hypothetical protein n=1 Tax=Niastella sp. OAS944 TaxID=2664089 RepID=UPI0034848D46|nr:hypothetical protein [Chitinophagaceae bacterium OAS944]
MYRLVFYSCCVFCVVYFGAFVRMVVGGYWYAAIASAFVTLLVSIPLITYYVKWRKPVFIPLKWSKVPSADKYRWVRKGTAALFCSVVIGATQHHYYNEGIAMAAVCTVFLLPIDKWIFGPASKYPINPWRSTRYVIIVGVRNFGVYYCLWHLGNYINIESTYTYQESIRGMIIGASLLLIRPLVLLVAPEKPPKTMNINKVAETKEPTVAIEPAKEAELIPATVVEVEEVVPEKTSEKKQEQPQPDLKTLKETYVGLHDLTNQARGFAFQRFLHSLFTAHDLITRSAFRLKGEEIDGSFELGSHTWLLEAKWYSVPTPQSDLLVFNGKVEGKSTWARGIFISYAGFSADGLIAFRHGKRTSIIGMDGNDLLLILDGVVTLQDAIKLKSMKAVENNDFFVPLSALL